MIFADKLIQLRKKSGWSQEELAEQMNVTRQSVSKWEGAQSVPDLEKMVRLSELFGVSTDYLLKDEIEQTEFINASKETSHVKRVSMEEANAFLSVKAATSKSIAYGVFLCILSPICLLILGAISELPEYGLSENAAGGIGMIILLFLIAAAVAIFISCDSKTASFEYLEKEAFETEYGVFGMVKEHKEQYKDTCTKHNIIGSCLCIFSIIPLYIGCMINENDDLLLVVMLSVSFILAGIGIMFFIRCGIIKASFEKLLQEGDYTKEKKRKSPVITAFSSSYWLMTTVIYLSYSLTTKNWDYSWIIWVIAGVLFPAIIAIINAFLQK